MIDANRVQTILPLNVQNFGAVGNGVHDDTAAIKAARDACPAQGGAVYLPRGIYKISDEIVGRANVFFFGDGTEATTIHRVAGGLTTECFTWTDVNNFGLTNLSVYSDVGNVMKIEASAADIYRAIFQNVYVQELEASSSAILFAPGLGRFVYFPIFLNMQIDGGASANGAARVGFNFAGPSNVIGPTILGGYITRVATALECLFVETADIDTAIHGCSNPAGTGTAIHIGTFPSSNYNRFHNMRLEGNEIQWNLEAGPANGGTQIHCRVVAPPPFPAQAINNQFAAIDGVDPSNGVINQPTVFQTNFPNLKQDTILPKTGGGAISIGDAAGGVTLPGSLVLELLARYRVPNTWGHVFQAPDNSGAIAIFGDGIAHGGLWQGNANNYDFYEKSGTAKLMGLVLPTVNDDTAMFVVWRKAGVQTLALVSVGAADSGGVGKRLLVIPN